MWLLYRVPLFCLFSLSASLVKDCYLKEKWIPTKTGYDRKYFDEVYRLNSELNTPIFYTGWFNTEELSPFVSIDRTTKLNSCTMLQKVYWNASDMSFLSMEYGCSDWDWPTVLVYFNDDLTLGILTECSRSEKIRHVLVEQESLKNNTPSRPEIQDLVRRYEGNDIHLRPWTIEDNVPCSAALGFPYCICKNQTDLMSIYPIGYSFIVALAFVVFLIVLIVSYVN